MSIEDQERMVADLKMQKRWTAAVLREVEANLAAAMINLSRARDQRR